MSGIAWLRELSLRSKLAITVMGGAVALLGGSTYISFGYWRREALVAAEQQALLAAGSSRAALEAALVAGDRDEARRGLRKLVRSGAVAAARVYASDGTVVLSAAPAEEGRRLASLWIPAATLLPGAGVVRQSRDREVLHAFLPLAVPGAALFQVEFGLAPLQAAMERGARLGIGLLVVSLLTLAAILFTMLEREVVAPVQRLAGLVAPDDAGAGNRTEDELVRIEAGVTRLIEREEAAERQMVEQAGLAQVGELAAEMAHEFKRPLASVSAAIEVLQREYALDARGQQFLEMVQAQVQRLAETTRDLFALARPGGLELRCLDVRRVVDAALMHLSGHPALRSPECRAVAVQREYDVAMPPVRGDARRLEQAVANILLNAVEAMPEGGSLRVLVRGIAPGGAELEFTDTGPGIPPDEVERVLRPFYSTKPLGTGLGLPLVARIIAAHEGELSIGPAPGGGTRVRIRLPAQCPATAEPG